MTPTDDPKDRNAEDLDAREAEASTPAQEQSADASTQPGPAADRTEAPEAAEGAPQERRPLDVYAVLRVSIVQLSGVAWQMMGLQADPFTNEVRKDIEQARLAIDAAAALVDKLIPHVQGQEVRDYQSLITDLRLNFVKQSGDEAKTD